MLSDKFAIDRYAYGQGSVVYSPQINWLGFTDGAANDIFSSPTFNTGLPGDLGPNFRYLVPAPSGAMIVGLSCVLVARRRL